MKDFIQKFQPSSPGFIKQRLYLQTGIVALFLVMMIIISAWTGNTLSMITAIARFERTHTVSRLEAKSALLEFLATKESKARESFFRNMGITQSYNKVFSQLLTLRTTCSDKEFTQIIENTFKEADQQTAKIIVNRIQTLHWNSIIKELVDYADKANHAGEKIVALATLAMNEENKMEQLSILSKIRKAEADFISYERSFSERCSDLANEIATFFNYVSIIILILSVSFTGLITYLLARSLLKQAVKHSRDLQESRKQYLNLVEGTPDLITRVDTDGHFVFVNHAALEIFGLSPEECASRLCFDFIHPDDKERTIAAFQSWFKSGGDIFRFENRQIGIDGREHYMAWSITPEKDEDDVIIGFASTAKDISKLKQAEDDLRESEFLFSQVFEQSSTSTSLCSPDGTIFKVNDEFCKMFGVEEDVILSSGYNLFKDEAVADTRVISSLKEVFNGKKSNNWEVCFNIDVASKSTNTPTSKTGTINLKVFGYPVVNNKGGLEYVVLQHYDVTEQVLAEEERIKLEAKLHQSQKMETIGTLAGGIAHDFNNILFPIIGYTEMLLEDLPEGSTQRENLDEILNGALRAGNLVKQILTFSRQDGNQFRLFKIQPVVKEALTLIRSTVTATITITQEISSDCGIIKADPTQIHQIVMNLATNAYHAMEENGGELTVNLKEITFDETDVINLDINPGSYACLTVADTGIGMDRHVLDRIFDPFFTTKTQGKGTGLGLSVIHGIIKNSGGHINVYSEIGKGTEFNVYLPIAKNHSDLQKLPRKEPIKGGAERILIVDDENTILKMEQQMLTRMGYQVTSFNNSVEALDTFRLTPDNFDLVISDMAMPNISGDRLAFELIKVRPDIPILLCTGFSDRIPEEKAKAIGIKGFLMKPIVQADFSMKIRAILDN